MANSTKRVCIPMDREGYEKIVDDPQQFRERLDSLIGRYPELFPAGIEQGYWLYGWERQSVKMPEAAFRRICLCARNEAGKRQVYQVVPSFVMPYRVGETDVIEKALFLRRFEVPFWGLTYVFRRDNMYWQRIVMSLGRNEIVGVTIKDPDRLPEHVLADEKHTRFNGGKAYIATTAAKRCVLGASLALAADEAQLTEAYGHFRREVQCMQPNYQLQTVNTDGWSATQLAWKTVFPAVTIILCFLHAFLSIRDRAKHLKDTFCAIRQRIWDIYRADHADNFLQQITDFQYWAQLNVTGSALQAILKLCSKARLFVLAFDHPLAYRTSNMLDCQFDAFDRYLYDVRYSMVISCPPNTKSVSGPCSITSAPSALAPNSAILTSLLFINSMALSITITGFTICSSPLRSVVAELSTQSVRSRKNLSRWELGCLPVFNGENRGGSTTSGSE